MYCMLNQTLVVHVLCKVLQWPYNYEYIWRVYVQMLLE